MLAVSAGAYHTVCVTASGRTFSMGRGEGGRLGTGSEDDEWFPREVSGAADGQPTADGLPAAAAGGGLRAARAVQPACGAAHTLVLTAAGDVYGFGRAVRPRAAAPSATRTCDLAGAAEPRPLRRLRFRPDGSPLR